MKHKILLLGMGFWGRRWLELILKSEQCHLAGAAGSEDEMQEICADYGINPVITFTDFRKSIVQTDADIAVVVLPGVLHFEADRLALEKGMNLITEKPLAMDMEEAMELLRLKAQYPARRFMTSQNYRWRPHNQAIKRAIDHGMIGRMESILLEFRQQEDLQGYRAGLEMPLLQDVSIHHFDLIRFFTGADCKEAYCRVSRPSWSLYEGKPDRYAVFQMTNGVTVTYSGSWAARGKETSWDGNFTITGDKGCLTLDADGAVYFYKHERAEVVVLNTGRQQGEEILQPEMKYTEMEYGFHMFLDSLEQGDVPETSLEDNVKSFAMVMACLESAKQGMVVDCSELLRQYAR